MKQILQDIKSGRTYIEDAPAPRCGTGSVLIGTSRSLISAGTERMLVEFSKGNIIQKARAQPERVKQVLDKIRTDGMIPTLEAVFAKLGEPLPLGYCNAGRVIDHDHGDIEIKSLFPAGTRVVSNGPHAEIVSASSNLVAKIPDNVTDDEAVFTVLGSVGLQGIRLANPTLGEKVFVMGMGLIGLISVQILKANGCRVICSDYNPQRLSMARQFGCETVDLSADGEPVDAAMAFTQGRGVDAVLITASSKSNEPIEQAAKMCRKLGRVVLVGVVGLELNRGDFYEKELTFQVSCSYGPGRYDPNYEQKGQDYPLGFVRWTEHRNFEAILQLMSSGQLDVKPLITHRFAIDEAQLAYRTLMEDESSLGILLEYEKAYSATEESVRKPAHTIELSSPAKGACRVGIVGAGNFTKMVMLPALKNANCAMILIASATGVTGTTAARKFGIAKSTTDTDSLFDDPDINTVFITTRHDSHARFACQALAAGKSVFVEKPLAISLEGMRSIMAGMGKISSDPASSKPFLMVGFNRRFSPHILQMRKLLALRKGPACVTYTINAGAAPKDSWVQDPNIGGGRIVGEGCHFIDTIRFLLGNSIVSIFAQQVDNALDDILDDKMSILLKFEDGSIGTVNYWANGSKTYPKEQIVAFADGKVLKMDNFRVTRGWGFRRFTKHKTLRQDKGHQAEVAAFCELVSTGGKHLIPFNEIVEVTLASFAAVESAHTGEAQLLKNWESLLDSSEE